MSESRPKLEQEGEATETVLFKNEDGIMADLAPKVEKYNLAAMVETLTPTKRRVYDWVAEKVSSRH